MLLHICLPLLLLPPSLSSRNATRIPRNDDLDVDPQKRALPILANPSSLHMYNSSTVDAVTMQVQTSLDHNYVITCDSVAYGSGLNAPSRSTALRQSPMGDISRYESVIQIRPNQLGPFQATWILKSWTSRLHRLQCPLRLLGCKDPSRARCRRVLDSCRIRRIYLCL